MHCREMKNLRKGAHDKHAAGGLTELYLSCAEQVGELDEEV